MADFRGFPPLDANFTMTPNMFYDLVMFGPHTPGVKVVVAAVIRHTLGFVNQATGERRLEAGLSLGDFERICRISRTSARDSVDAAIAAGFVVQTAAATNHSAARYALRWADGEQQIRAIERQRKALGVKRRGRAVDPPSSPRRVANGADPISRGAKSGPPKFARPKSAPPKDSEINPESGRNEESEIPTLNVWDDVNFVASGGSGRGVFSGAFERQAAMIAAELQDLGSERRHRQLLEICDRHDLGDLVDSALQATRARMAKEGKRGAVERPGAYYQSILIRSLEDRQVFVPKAGEDDADEVRRLARESMGFK